MNRNATNTRSSMQSSAQETRAYYAQHDFSGPAKLSTTVVHALSDVANVDATEIETTLFQHVDPDGLNSLFSPLDSETPRATGHVAFSMLGYDLTIYSNGQIVISPRRQPAQSRQQF